MAELQAKALRNQGTITRAKLLVILYPSISQSIYTYFTHNTQRVINTVKPKLLSVFKVAPRQTISAAVLPKVLLVWSCIIRKTFDVSAGLVMHA